jgi:hypothetical protein
MIFAFLSRYFDSSLNFKLGEIMLKRLLLPIVFVPVIVSATFIDFTSDHYSGITGEQSFDQTVMLEGHNPNNIGLQPADMTLSTTYTLTWLGGDGIGSSGKNTEYIDGYEWLHIDFDRDVFISDVALSNLFLEEFGTYSYAEGGLYMLDRDGTHNTFYAEKSTNELFTVAVNDTCRSIQFGAKGSSLNLNEFGIVGMDISYVPDTSLISLMSVSLSSFIGLFFLRRKKSNSRK